jgi:ATP-binding protein involved in chromosome partitioning
MYGPNVPIMLGLKAKLETDGKKIVPAERYGIQAISMGFLTDDDSPVIWRGPMLHGAMQQFFRDVRWDHIDYLIVDMPPGTGDIALSLSQTVPVAGAVVVTTPQLVSLADTRRAIQMYRKLNIPPIGLIENGAMRVPQLRPRATCSARAAARCWPRDVDAVPRPYSALRAGARRRRLGRAGRAR